MTNPAAPPAQADIVPENKMTIDSFLKQSYNHAKKHLQDGVAFIHDGASFIKEEFSAMYDITGDYLHKVVLPVNNFLKDLTQIETELQQEVSRESTPFISLQGKLVPIDQVLAGPMEENY